MAAGRPRDWIQRHRDAADILVSTAFGVVLGGLAFIQRDAAADAVLPSGTLGAAMAALVLWSLRRRRARVELDARRALEQRLSIARELHDVVAHHVSLVGIQAAAARRTLGGPQQPTAEALEAIEAASHAAIVDMQRLVTALRGDGAAELAPPPTLADLPDLVATMRGAGLQIEYDASTVASTPAVGLAVYRIAQEALTNVAEHAGSAVVRVRLVPDGDDLVLTVEDRGDRAAADRPARGASGHRGLGIPGMRDRAAAVGGTLDAGVTSDGGFRVVARVPGARA